MEKTDFPIKVVAIRKGDHRPPPENQGGKAKVFGKVTEGTRRVLADQVEGAYQYFSQQFQRWPDIPAVVKITLTVKAISAPLKAQK